MNTKKGLIIFLVVAILTVSWLIYDYTKKSINLTTEGYSPDFGLITARDEQTFKFNAGNLMSLSSNFGDGEEIMSYQGGTFPMTQKIEKRSRLEPKKPTIFDASERETNKKRLQRLIDRYGKFVSEAAAKFGVPQLYIYIVMAVENPDGKANKLSDTGAYVGLMQLGKKDAADSIATQKRRRLLTVDDLKFFQSRIGKSVFTNLNSVTNESLFNAETNINVGALHLSEQIVHNKFDIVNDIHKIFFSYNRGKNRMSNDKTLNLGIDELINRYLGTVHNTGAEYVIRALGPNGAADILVNDLGITS